tara:strand:+ start:2897 stop:3877 length:981 start_codon:yes stop_codon:yes gene_type:complete
MKIGNIKVEGLARLAPMAGISNAPFRTIAKECGSGLTTSEEIDANGLIKRSKKTLDDIAKYYPEERPIALQILGSDKESLVIGSKMLQDSGADIIDLNMGCPVPKITKTGRGSAMMKDLKNTSKILSAMRKVIKVPFTIKIRSGWDEKNLNAVEVAKIAEDIGIDAITVHPRTRAQRFTGKSNWDVISEVVSSVAIPVTGNGDVSSISEAERMKKYTGCESVMIGRGAIGKPWIFDENYENLSYEEKYEYKTKIINRHIRLIKNHFSEHIALLQMQRHLSWYAGGQDRVRSFRVSLFSTKTFDDAMNVFNTYWSSLQNYNKLQKVV